MDELTQVVLDFQGGKLDEGQATAKVAVFLFQYLEDQYGKAEDDNSDLLAEFYPRIPRMIQKFQFDGTPFLHYLKRSIKMQKKSMAIRQCRNRHWQYALTESDTMLLAEDDGSSWGEECVKTPPQLSALTQGKRFTPEVLKKRLLLVALRSAPFLDEEQIEQVAISTESDLAWLQACVYRIKAQLHSKMTRLTTLARRRSFLFSRRLQAENEMKLLVDEDQRKQLQFKISKLRQSQQRLLENIRKVQITPTHFDLSKILNVPKGTVDSCLYYLKNSVVQEYIDPYDSSAGFQQPSQKTGTRCSYANPVPQPGVASAWRHGPGRLGPR